MKNKDSNRWLWPPLDQWITVWGLWVIAGIAILTSEGVLFLTNLSGTRWVWFYAVGLGVAVLGAVLIFYAKLPLYRHRRFFTFGSQALPEDRRAFYRWGYRFFIVGASLLALLILSSQ